MKHVLITGGTRGIGAACVKLFANNGYQVSFLYRSSARLAEEIEQQTGAKGYRADVANPVEVQNALLCVKEQSGTVDVLINNAGIAQAKLTQDITNEDWQRMIQTNLSGAFFVTRSLLPDMIAKQCGRIINIGSMWGKCGASCEVHYSAAKAGIRGLTLALAKEVGPSGITVNAIEPGVIDTDMNAGLSQEDMSALVIDTPLGRLGTPLDVADLAYFLASEKASFITGQIIGVDGGYAI